MKAIAVGFGLASLLVLRAAVPAFADDGPPVHCADGSTAVTSKCEMTLIRDAGLQSAQQYQVAISGDGKTAWIGGLTVDPASRLHYFVASYDTATGINHWRAHYDSPIANGNASGFRVSVSPDDSVVAVTGQALVPLNDGSGQNQYRAITVTWDAVTGAQHWAVQTRSGSTGYRLVFAPDSHTLYVGGQVYTYQTGSDPTTETGDDWTIAAYDVATGSERWYTKITAPYIVGNNSDYLDFLAVSADGKHVAATGRRPESGITDGFGNNRGVQWATAVLDSTTGSVSWLQTYAGGLGNDYPHEVAFTPDGSTVVVCGEIQTPTGGTNNIAAIVAYSAADGAKLWDDRVTPANVAATLAPALAIAPDSSTVYVAMEWTDQGSGADYVTRALRRADGSTEWTSSYAQPGADIPTAIAASPDGGTVYTTGQSQQPLTGYDAATIAYRATSGAERWVANYAGPGPMSNQDEQNETVAVSGTATRVAVGADSPNADGHLAIALLVYDTSSDAVGSPAQVPESPGVTPLAVAGAGALIGAALLRRRDLRSLQSAARV